MIRAGFYPAHSAQISRFVFQAHTKTRYMEVPITQAK